MGFICQRHGRRALWLIVVSLLQCGAATAAERSALIDLAPDIQAVRDEYGMPAVAVAVIVDGKLHGAGVVGVRKHGSDVKATLDDPFHLGSCTKAMTGSLICFLVRQGKLRWDAPLTEYFPDLKERMHPAYRGVTLVHLLSHRAGVPPMTAGFAPVEGAELLRILAIASCREQRRRVAEIVLTQAPVCKPEEKELYSNAGYTLAGVIAEEAMGQDYETLLQRLLLKPLGMDSAGFGAMGTTDQTDAPWQHRMDGDKTVAVNPGPRSDNPPFITPAGRVHCSILDWAKYIECVLAAMRGQEGLLDPSDMGPLKDPPFGGNYALGWGIHERPWGGGRVLSHAGSNTMSYCVTWVAPNRNFAVLTATNCSGQNIPQGLDRLCAAMIARFLEKHGAQ